MNVVKRLSYIDVAKGLLILLVVYDHLPDMYMYKLNLSNEYIEYLDKTQWVYKLFFMLAFFCITGMCSNFNKDFKTFFISNYKSLIIPNVILGMILEPTWLGGGNFTWWMFLVPFSFVCFKNDILFCQEKSR